MLKNEKKEKKYTFLCHFDYAINSQSIFSLECEKIRKGNLIKMFEKLFIVD